jgi:capsular exopolysaccharide synthesis family protein
MLKDLISLKNPKSRAAEAYRTLRTNIQFSSLDEEIKSIVVTSSGPGEGKSTTMANLAIAMAQSGKKVVLMDCDFRKPTIHKKFGLPNSQGLINILAQDRKFEEIIITTDVNNLYVIPSGPVPPNPSELLGTKKMKALLTELTRIFDMVLIDAPPVLAVTDAQILSTIVNGTIIVSAYGKSDKHALLKAKENIEKVGGKILGVVINKVPEQANGYYGKYY